MPAAETLVTKLLFILLVVYRSMITGKSRENLVTKFFPPFMSCLKLTVCIRKSVVFWFGTNRKHKEYICFFCDTSPESLRMQPNPVAVQPSDKPKHSRGGTESHIDANESPVTECKRDKSQYEKHDRLEGLRAGHYILGR